MRRKKLHALVICQLKTVKTAREKAFLESFLQKLCILEVHGLSPVADVAELRNKYQRIAAEIIKKALGLVINLTDEFVGVRERRAAADKLSLGVQLFARLYDALAAQKSRLMDDFIGERVPVLNDDFGRGSQADSARLLESALGFDIEVTQVGDFVAPEFRADRIVSVGHKEVENAAAKRELAAALNSVEPLVAEKCQRAHRAVEVEGLALPHRKDDIREEVLRNGELARRVKAGNHNVALLLDQLEKNLEPQMLVLVGAAL